MPTYNGTSGNDTINGSVDADTIDGQLGNDLVYAGSGNDTAIGGAGTDTLYGDSGDDTLSGNGGSDTLSGGAGNDLVMGDLTSASGFTDIIVNDPTITGDYSLGSPQYTRTLDLTDGAALGVIEYDFYRIDSWDGESSRVYINGAQVFSFAPYLVGTGGNYFASGTFAGGRWTVSSTTPDAHLGGNSNWTDRLYNVRIELDNPGNSINFAVDSTLDQGYPDESWRIGNFRAYSTDGIAAVGNDVLSGGDGSDTLIGNGGNDTLYGGADDDDISVGGSDIGYGDGGDDVFTVDTRDGVANINATIIGGETGQDATDTSNGAAGDVLDLSATTQSQNIVFTGAEAGTVNGLDADGTTDLTFSEIEVVRTGAGNDTINAAGMTGPITVDAGAGNDNVRGGAGNDSLTGGSGNDTLYGEAGNDTLDGGDNSDLVYGGSANDNISGGAGVDTLYGDGGDDSLNGGGDTDILYGASGNDSLSGDAGNDVLFGGINNDTLYGGDGNDSLTAGHGDDTLDGGAGNDLLTGDGTATNFAATGNLITNGNFSAPLTTGWTVNNPTGGTAPITNVGYLVFNSSNEATYGDSVQQNITTNIGQTYSGSFVLAESGAFGAADHTVRIDVLDGSGNVIHTQTEVALNDAAGRSVNFSFDAVSATTTLRITNTSSTNSVNTDLVITDVVIQGVASSSGNDSLTGGAGDDTLEGSVGNDTLVGGDGDDDLIVGAGDLAQGGAGDDVFTFDASHAGNSAITVVGGDTDQDMTSTANGGMGDMLDLRGLTNVTLNETDALSGTATYQNTAGQTVTINYSGIENILDGVVNGTSGNDVMNIGYTDADADQIDGSVSKNDTIYAGAGDDSVTAGVGNDSVFGGSGNDALTGGTGSDTLYGDSGDDTLSGNAGNDTLYGGAGNDSVMGDLGSAPSLNDTITNDPTVSGHYAVGSPQYTRTFDLTDGAPHAVIEYDFYRYDSWDAESSRVYINGTQAFSFVPYYQGNTAAYFASGTFAGGRWTVSSTNPEAHLGGNGGWTDRLYNVRIELDNPGNSVNFGIDSTLDEDASNESWRVGNFRVYSTDSLISPIGDDVLSGGDGNDTLTGNAGNDTLYGGNDADTLSGGAGNDSLFGDAGNDSLLGNADNDTLSGGDGNDTLLGQAGNDSLAGGAGDDQLSGDGFETAELLVNGDFATGTNNTAPVSWVVGNPTGGFGPTHSDGKVLFNPANEGIYGDSIQQTFTTVVGQTYTTSFNVFENGTGSGTHTVRVDVLNASNAVISTQDVTVLDGASQTVQFSFQAATGTSTLRFTHTASSNGNLSNPGLDNISVTGPVLTTGNDTLDGGAGNDILDGGTGNDNLQGGAGNDMLDGGTGNDSLMAGSGSDTLYGGEGNDTVIGDTDDNLVVNGSFESFTSAGGDWWGHFASTINGWQTNGGNQELGNAAWQGSVPDGTYLIDMDRSPGNVTISQTISGVTTGESYELSFSTKQGFGASQNLEVYWGGQFVGRVTGGPNTFVNNTFTVVGGAGNGQNVLEFREVGTVDSTGTLLDDIRLRPVVSTADNNDIIYGGAGNDTLVGGAGNDSIYVGATDSAHGGAGDDRFLIDASDTMFDLNITINGGEVAETTGDVIDLASSNSNLTVTYTRNEAGTVNGLDADTLADITFTNIESMLIGNGNNVVNASVVTSNFNIAGGTGNDTLIGGAGNDALTGGAGNDSISGNAGNDSITGDAGNDILYGGLGEDTVSGGADNDAVYGDAGNDSLSGDAGNDSIYGGDGNDTMTGGDGNDVLQSGEGNDLLIGSAGNDSMWSGNGNDTLRVGGADWAAAEAGDDLITIDATDANPNLNTTVYGGEGAETIGDRLDLSNFVNTTITYTGNDSGTVNGLDADTAVDITFYDMERVLTGDGNDTITVTGNMTIGLNADMGLGNDSVIGGNANDTVEAGAGNDSVMGALGDDSLSGGTGNDLIAGGTGSDRLFGGDGEDRLLGSIGSDVMFGGAGRDTMSGGEWSDTMSGGAGNDILNDNITSGELVTNGGFTLSASGVPTGWTTGGILSAPAPVVNTTEQNLSFNNSGGAAGGFAEQLLPTVAGSTYNTNFWAWEAGGGVANHQVLVEVRDTSGNVVYSETRWVNDANSQNFVFSFVSPTDGATLRITNTAITGDGTNSDLRVDSITVTGDVANTFANSADNFSGGSGDDTVDGGLGDDMLTGDAGNDSVIGGAGNDTIYGGTGNDVLDGGAGNDVVRGDDDNLVVNGSFEFLNSPTIVSYGAQASSLPGWQTNGGTIEFLTGNAGTDGAYVLDMERSPGNVTVWQTIAGVTQGEEYQLTFNAGQNGTTSHNLEVYWGGQLVRTVTGTPITLNTTTTLTLVGGAGNGLNVLEFREVGPVDWGGTILDNIRMVPTSTLALGASATYDDTITGAAGNDTLYGEAGNDSIVGGVDNDLIYGGAGNDTVAVGNADVAFGDGGDDTFRVDTTDTSTNPNATITGGETGETNGDVLDLSTATTNLTVNYTATNEAGTVNGLDADTLGDITFSQIERVQLGSGNDTINATLNTSSVNIDAGAGNDGLIGSSAADTLAGGAGNDILFGRDGNDLVQGGDGNDSMLGGGANDTMLGGAGDDTLIGANGSDELIGGSGNDILQGDIAFAATGNLIAGGDFTGANWDPIHGWTTTNPSSSHAPMIWDNYAYFNIHGDPGTGDAISQNIATNPNQTHTGTFSAYSTGTGTNILRLEVVDVASGTVLVSQTETIVGSAAWRTINFSFDALSPSTTVRIINVSTTDTNATDLVIDSVAVVGVASTAGNDSLQGGLGDDTLFGGAGSDTLAGSEGNDSIDAGAGDDDIIAAAGDVVAGGAGDDVFTFDPTLVGNAGITIVGGETGEDLFDAANGGSGDVLDLRGLRNVVVTTSGAEGGTATYVNDGNDTITVNYSEIERVVVSAGAVINGTTMTGSDIIVNGTGSGDTMGTTYVDVQGDYIDGIDGLNDTILAGAGNDIVDAGFGNDSASGGLGGDTISGGLGNDTLLGEDGNDSLMGGTGADLVYGGADNDTMVGGENSDTIYGGAGNDVFSDGTAILPNQQLVTNGTFVGTENAAPVGWTTSATGSGTAPVMNSQNLLFNGWSGAAGGVAQQALTTVPGSVYTGSFTATQSGVVAYHEVRVEVIDTATNAVLYTESRVLTDASTQTFNFNFTAFSGGTTLRISNPSISGNTASSDLRVDNVSVTGDVILPTTPNTADMFIGEAGDDTIDGGLGNDTLAGDEGNDSIAGGGGSDNITAGADNDTVVGGSGSDTIDGGTGNDSLAGDATMAFTATGNLIVNGAFADADAAAPAGWVVNNPTGSYAPSVYTNQLRFNLGGEATFGDSIQQTIATNPGQTYAGSFFVSEPDAGIATHSVRIEVLDSSGNVIFTQDEVVVDGASRTVSFNFEAVSPNSTIRLVHTNTTGDQWGSDLRIDDVRVVGLASTESNDSITGGAGDDTITGGGGNDTLAGQADNDSILGQTGNDSITGDAGNDTLVGGEGADTIYGGTGDDNINDGLGIGELITNGSFTNGDGALPSNWITGNTSTGGTLTYVYGGAVQYINGNSHGSYIQQSMNTVSGSQYNGSFTLSETGSVANHTMRVEVFDASNTVVYTQDVTVNDASTRDVGFSFTAGTGPSTLRISHVGTVGDNPGSDPRIDNVSIIGEIPGSTPVNNDVFRGDDGNDTINGGSGDDTLSGDAGNDSVLGEAGNDSLIGGDGLDTLLGGTGNDTLSGDADTPNLVTNGTFTIGTFTNVSGGVPTGWTTGHNNSGVAPAVYGDMVQFTHGNPAGGFIQQSISTVEGTTYDLSFSLSETGSVANHIVRVEVLNASGTVILTQDVTVNDGTPDSVTKDTFLSFTAGTGPSTLRFTHITAQGDNAGSDPRLDNVAIYAVAATGGDDSLVGGVGNDMLFGGAGNDALSVGATDIARGGLGDDTFRVDTTDTNTNLNTTILGGEGGETLGDALDISSYSNNVTVTYTANEAGIVNGLDTITNDAGDITFMQVERLLMGSGNDTINAGVTTTALNLDGAAGNDSLIAGSANDTLSGGTGNDTLRGNAGEDTMYGGDGQDLLYGGTNNDTLDGGAGNDTLYGGEGSDTLTGGTGSDVLHDGNRTGELVRGGNFTSATDAAVPAGWTTGNTSGGSAPAIWSNTLQFPYNNAINGFAQQSLDTVEGTLYAGSFTLTQTGNVAEHTVRVEVLNAAGVVVYTQNYTSYGSTPETVNFAFTAGTGPSTLRFTNTAVVGDNNSSDLRIDNVSVIGELLGTDNTSDDVFSGNDGDDTINSGSGNDTVYGGEGNDLLAAGAGDDIATGEAGNDSIYGRTGNDTLDGGAGNDLISGGTGNDSLVGDAGNDTIQGGTGVDTIYGGTGNDVINDGFGPGQLITNGAFDSPIHGQGWTATATNGGTAPATWTGGGQFNHSNAAPGGTLSQTVTTIAGETYSTSFRLNELGGVATHTMRVDVLDGSGTVLYTQTITVEDGVTRDFSFNFQAVSGTSRIVFTNVSGTGDLTNSDVMVDNVSIIGQSPNYVANGDDIFSGGEGDDTISGGVGNDALSGDAGNDSVSGDLGNDTISGADGNDTLVGGIGNDTITGDQGNDLLFGDGSNGSYAATFTDTAMYGPFGGDGAGTQQYTRALPMADGFTYGVIEFDFLKMGSWDENNASGVNERFVAYVNNVSVFSFTPDGIDSGYGNGANASGTFAGGRWSVVSSGVDGSIPGYAGASNRFYNVRIELDNPTSSVNIGVGAFLNEGVANESYSVGNFRTYPTNVIGGGPLANDENDNISGGFGDDTIYGGTGNDTLTGDAGNDSIRAGAGNDAVTGGDDNDTLIGEAGEDTLYGGAGNDSLSGREGIDLVFGEAGNDTLEGGDGNDTLYGGTGDDVLSDGLSVQELITNGTFSTDYNTTGWTTQGGVGISTPGVWVGAMNFNHSGNTGLGGSARQSVSTVAGETYTASFRAAEYGGGVATQTVRVDVLDGSGTVIYTKTIVLTDGMSSNETFTFQALSGTSTIVFTNTGVTGDHGSSDLQIDNVSIVGLSGVAVPVSNDVFSGGDGNDTINGGGGSDTLYGDAGNDSLIGSAGNDTLFGGAGDDTLAVGGADTAVGGDGSDRFVIDATDTNTNLSATVTGGEVGDAAGDVLDVTSNTNNLSITYTNTEAGTIGGLDADTMADITFTEIERLLTGNGNDTINAAALQTGINIDTGIGNDSVIGGAGHDTVYGGAGNDTLSGDLSFTATGNLIVNGNFNTGTTSSWTVNNGRSPNRCKQCPYSERQQRNHLWRLG